MPADIDTSPPAWLTRNWAPREPFDPTPWLQERYRWQVEQAKLPLELQQMELQNAQARTAIEAQGMQNELRGIQLMQYQQELPELGRIMAETGGDPEKLLAAPVRTFSSPQIQKQYLDTLEAAAATKQGLLMKQRMIGQMKVANEILSRGGTLPKPLDDGTYDPQELGDAMRAVTVREEAAKIKEIEARNAWHLSTTGGMSPPERRAESLRRARQALDDALITGDDSQIADAQQFLTDLQTAIARERKDPVEQTQLQLLRQTINQIDKDLGNVVLQSKWPELRERRKELQRKLDNWGGPSGASTSAPEEPQKTIGDFKIRVVR